MKNFIFNADLNRLELNINITSEEAELIIQARERKYGRALVEGYSGARISLKQRGYFYQHAKNEQHEGAHFWRKYLVFKKDYIKPIYR